MGGRLPVEALWPPRSVVNISIPINILFYNGRLLLAFMCHAVEG